MKYKLQKCHPSYVCIIIVYCYKDAIPNGIVVPVLKQLAINIQSLWDWLRISRCSRLVICVYIKHHSYYQKGQVAT